MKRTILATLTLLMFLSLSSITLDEAKEIAYQRNLSHQNAVNSEKSATAQKYQAYSAILPSVRARGSLSDEDLSLDDETYSISLTQPIFQGGNIIYGMKIAGASQEIAENNTLISKINLYTQVENLYYSVLEKKYVYDNAQKTLERSQLQLSKAKTQYEMGAISSTDYIQFQLDESQQELALINAENDYQTTLEEFNNLLNTNNELPEELETEIALKEAQKISTFNKELISSLYDQILGEVLNQNLNLKNSEVNTDIAKSNLRLSQTAFLPSIDLQASKSWVKNDMFENYEDSETYSLNLSLSLFPLVDKGFSYSQKKYSYKSSLNTQIDAQKNIELQTQSALNNLVAASKSMLSSQIAKDQSEKLYNQSKLKHELGELSTTDYLSASISLSSARKQYISSIYNYLRSKSAINELLSEENYKKLNTILFGEE